MVNKRLLVLLVTKLETVSDRDFDIHDYFNWVTGAPSDTIGYATTIPEWNEWGLKRIGREYDWEFRGNEHMLPEELGKELGFDAEQSRLIFQADCMIYPQSRKEVIDRIKAIICPGCGGTKEVLGPFGESMEQCPICKGTGYED